jgi:hypothetical protein
MSVRLIAILTMVVFFLSPPGDFCPSSDSTDSDSQLGYLVFSDDFSGELTGKWILSSPRSPRINMYRGHPAPSADNYGDGTRNSGLLSKRSFSLTPGTIIRCDMYVSPRSESAWIGGSFGLPRNPAVFRKGEWPEWLVGMSYNYIGKLEWTKGPFHEEGTLICYLIDEDGKLEVNRVPYTNRYLNGWHTFEIMIEASGFVEFRIDGELVYYSRKRFSPLRTHLPLLLGHRSGSRGKVYHDNVEVFTYKKKLAPPTAGLTLKNKDVEK